MKGWLHTLEEPVRRFLIEWGGATEAAGPSEDESDFSDDEVVFVGRKRTTQEESGWKKAHREVQEQQIDRGMIFDSLEDDESGAFKYVPPPSPLLPLLIPFHRRTTCN